MRLDPRSLRPLRGPNLDIFNGVGAWAYSPDRSRLALGTACQAGISVGTLQLVDVRRMRPVGCFAIGFVPGVPVAAQGRIAAAAWPTPNQLLVVADSPLSFLLIDPRARRIVKRTPVDGVGLAGTARAGDRLVVLVGRTFREPQRLVVAEARGSVRSVGIEAPRASDLVVDPSGRRAYVVSAGTVAEVDLDTLAVSYHELREPASVLARLFSWLVPAAQAKLVSQETRRALWLGGGLIASFGSDVVVDGRTARTVPTGLSLIDTRTWTVRMIDEQVSFALLVGNVLLGAGADEIGLVAYDLQGTRRFQLFRGRSLALSETYGGKAYVHVGSKPAPQVVDVRTGRVLGARRAPLPLLLVER